MFKKFVAAFFAIVFSAVFAGCGTKMGEDVSSDISSILEPDNSNSAQQNNNSNTPNTSINNSSMPNSNTTSEAKISKEKAKEIALRHANVNEDKVSDFEIDLDTENGVLVYEISFDSNGKEYDYDVNATTGDITDSKHEIID